METLRRIFSLPDLRAKIILTLFLLAVCRIGVFIPVPGINKEAALQAYAETLGGQQNLFQLVNVFTGGAFSNMTVAALGVMPYISASILMQLFSAIFPAFQRELKENPVAGRRKLIRWTRLLTVIFCVF